MNHHNRAGIWAVGGFLLGLGVSGFSYLETRYQETLQYLTPQAGPNVASDAHFKLLALQRLRSPQSYTHPQGLWTDWVSLYYDRRSQSDPLPSPVSALFLKWGRPDGTLENTSESLTAARVALSRVPLDDLEKRLQRQFQDSMLHVNSSTPDALFKPNTVLFKYAELTDRFRKPIFN